MTPEVIEALAQAPLVLVLIYLLIRQQGEKEKLLAGMIEMGRDHAKQLMEIIARIYTPPPPPQDKPD